MGKVKVIKSKSTVKDEETSAINSFAEIFNSSKIAEAQFADQARKIRESSSKKCKILMPDVKPSVGIELIKQAVAAVLNKK